MATRHPDGTVSITTKITHQEALSALSEHVYSPKFDPDDWSLGDGRDLERMANRIFDAIRDRNRGKW